jgi:hypothetical protein
MHIDKHQALQHLGVVSILYSFCRNIKWTKTFLCEYDA